MIDSSETLSRPFLRSMAQAYEMVSASQASFDLDSQRCPCPVETSIVMEDTVTCGLPLGVEAHVLIVQPRKPKPRWERAVKG